MLSGIQFVHKNKYVSKSLKKTKTSLKQREQKHVLFHEEQCYHEEGNTSTNTQLETKAKREEWMLGDFDTILQGQTYKSHRGTRPVQPKGDPDAVKILRDRELNPFYLNGENGLPSTMQLKSLQEKSRNTPTHISKNECTVHCPPQLLKGIYVKQKSNVMDKKKLSRNSQEDNTIHLNKCQHKTTLQLSNKKEFENLAHHQDDANQLALNKLRKNNQAKMNESSRRDNAEHNPQHELKYAVQLTTFSSNKTGQDKWEKVTTLKTKNSYKLRNKTRNSSLDALCKETHTSSISDLDTLLEKNMERYHFEEYGENHDEIGQYSEMRIEPKRLKTIRNTSVPNGSFNVGTVPFSRRPSKCFFCFDNETFEKIRHTSLVAVSQQAYLCYQSFKQCVVPFHLFISPKKHVGSSANLEENVYQEIRNFQKSLVACLDAQNIGVVFIESMTYNVEKEKQFLGGGSHLVIDCLGIPVENFEDCKIYFYKALSEYGDEWSQNKKLIPVPTSSQGCRKILPKNFPYFYVNFGLGEGYLHLIEDNHFSKSFGIEIIKGIMETDRFTTCFSSTVDLQNTILSFKKKYEKYDWTQSRYHV
ncbi:CWF19-like protein 2 [Hylaeus volcanicus]|uniref:CWF19-like protein 2 n=1 Tax=Hylaeus volcanicus TaxID=313075 RepID=UPI0023B8740A|nr:CWF19-like protein 2 [Hylaeus volcanicus]